ncbi:MAG: methionine synthase [Bacteroidales bacterium]|jgi:hypothetical protein|nr:methionine synthase [Bacteroidales bacterium]
MSIDIMIHKTFLFDFRDLNLTVEQIERAMGYPEGESHEPIYDIAARVMKEAEAICDLKAEYRIFENITFDPTNKKVTIGEVTFDIGKIIFGQIRKADSLALFTCTAGKGIGENSRRAMKESDLLEGYIYDVIGSEAVEAAADLMQNELEVEMSMEGRKITNRFSPGYCGWDVSQQHRLFSLLPGNFCGIKLTDSALMDPVKSISGIIGLGPDVRRMPYTCSLCDMKDCIYRRKG